MLILSRKEGESILLGNNIKITIAGISKSGVKVGIDAPKNMMILRSELAEEVANENKQAINLADEIELIELSQKIKK
ncbi:MULTISPECIES: carbon storage regulator CsrA [unclassified Campylobacter]|uniref:carbon storage regulator CsrA n=1 Tax=unclassified Campylobacter TaxID=2593542 RepID=UPI001452098A|nr:MULTISPECIES: carbon storage regulator CsrA [unclassified Campylobacter]QCD52286.1 carbon storage regulator [Campylobacter sp. RM16192]QKG29607.1 carbon storage regulator [Campylobacter sp. RM16187]